MWFFEAIGNVLIEVIFYCYLALLLVIALFKKAGIFCVYLLEDSGDYFSYLFLRKEKLKKSICQNCHNKQACVLEDETLRWRSLDNRNWIQGSVSCPHSHDSLHASTTNDAPEYCPYALEHLVS